MFERYDYNGFRDTAEILAVHDDHVLYHVKTSGRHAYRYCFTTIAKFAQSGWTKVITA